MLATVTSRSSPRKRWSSCSVIAMAARREGMSVLQRELAPQDGLGGEADVETIRDGVADAAREGDHVVRTRAVVTDDRERVPAREADGSRALALRETGALDEPRRGELHAAVGLCPVRHAGPDARGDLTGVRGVDDRVHEERATAAVIWIC